MRFYWFGRLQVAKIRDYVTNLDEAGFYGLLLPYAVGYGDSFVRAAYSLNPDQKIKYLIAIRPHTLSPQYLAMLCRSMDKLDPGRVQINFVAGQIHENEKWFGGILGDITDDTPALERKKYLIDYVKNFTSLDFETPVVCVSGMTEEIFSLVEECADYNIIAYDAYRRQGGFRKISKPRIISMCPFIRDTQEEIDSLDLTDTPQDIVYTTEENLIALIKSLKEDGIEDVMFFSHGEEEEMDRIVEFVKKNKDLF